MKSVPESIVHVDYVEAAERMHKDMPLLSFEEWGILLEALEFALDPVDATESSRLFAEAVTELHKKLMRKNGVCT